MVRAGAATKKKLHRHLPTRPYSRFISRIALHHFAVKADSDAYARRRLSSRLGLWPVEQLSIGAPSIGEYQSRRKVQRYDSTRPATLIDAIPLSYTSRPMQPCRSAAGTPSQPPVADEIIGARRYCGPDTHHAATRARTLPMAGCI